MSALDIVRADIGQREGDFAIGVVAIADEGIDRQDGNAGVMRGLQHRNRLFLVIGRGHQRADIAAGDQRFDDRRRDGDVKAFRILLDDVEAEAARRAVNAARHGDVEGIGIDAGHESEVVALVKRGRGIAGVAGIDETRHIRVIDIVGGDDGVTGRDARRDAADAIENGRGQRHAQVAHIGRLLGDDQRNDAVFEEADILFAGVKQGDFDRALQAGVLDRGAGAERAKGIGGEHADNIRVRLQDSRSLLLRYIRAVLVVVDAGDHQAASFSRRQAAFFALVGCADARARVGDVDLGAFAQLVGQGRAGDVTALRVVGADIGDGEGHFAIGVVAIADEGIDGEHDDAGIVGGLQHRYRLFLVVRRCDQGVNIAAGDQGFDNRRRDGDVEALRILLDDRQAEVGRRLINAGAHGDVEGIRVDPRHKGDSVAIVLCDCAGREAQRKEQNCD